MIQLSIVVAHAERSAERRKTLRSLIMQFESEGFAFQGDKTWRHADGHRLTVDTTEGAPYVWSEAQWRASLAGEGTHCVMLNDDVILCDGFLRNLVSLLEVQPNVIISLYNISNLAKEAFKQNMRWVTTVDGLVGNAYVMPRAVLEDFLSWRDLYLLPEAKEKLSEDQQVNLYSMANSGLIWHTVPALVDHDTTVPSLYGNTQLRKPVVGPQKDMPTDWKTDGFHAGRVFIGNHRLLLTVLNREYIKAHNIIDKHFRLDAEPTGA